MFWILLIVLFNLCWWLFELILFVVFLFLLPFAVEVTKVSNVSFIVYFYAHLFCVIFYRSSSMRLLRSLLWDEEEGGWVWGEGGGVLFSDCCILEVFWLYWWWMGNSSVIGERMSVCWGTSVICWHVIIVELSWNCYLALAYTICFWCGVNSGGLLSWYVLRVVWI